MGGIVDLEEQAVLTTHIDPLYLRTLLERIGIVVGILEIQNSKDCISGMVVEDDRRAR